MSDDRPPTTTIEWPPPLPGRVGWAWVLALPWRRRRVRRIVALVRGRVRPGSVLADVGGGTGVGAEEAARGEPPGTYRHCLVLDPQRGMLLRARQHRPGAREVVVADAVDLPLPDRSVDVVLCLGVLCCMTDDSVPRAVAEMWRVLRPGGLAVVAVPLRRGDQDDPDFRSAGFVRLRQLRPGRSLYQRPSSADITPNR
jgi:ubiquinone/menaquinone biosynthesis C-methylase UbiE